MIVMATAAANYARGMRSALDLSGGKTRKAVRRFRHRTLMDDAKNLQSDFYQAVDKVVGQSELQHDDKIRAKVVEVITTHGQIHIVLRPVTSRQDLERIRKKVSAKSR